MSLSSLRFNTLSFDNLSGGGRQSDDINVGFTQSSSIAHNREYWYRMKRTRHRVIQTLPKNEKLMQKEKSSVLRYLLTLLGQKVDSVTMIFREISPQILRLIFLQNQYTRR